MSGFWWNFVAYVLIFDINVSTGADMFRGFLQFIHLYFLSRFCKRGGSNIRGLELEICKGVSVCDMMCPTGW